jgi:hypothetical protein
VTAITDLWFSADCAFGSQRRAAAGLTALRPLFAELGIQAVAKAQICDGRHSNAGGGVPHVYPPSQQMEKEMATKIKTSATSEQVREPTPELTEEQLEQVSGGIIAVLIGLLLPSAPPSPTKHSM